MERTTRLSLSIALALAAGVALAAGSGCRRSGTPAGALKKQAGEKVEKIVFVGQQNACACTKRVVDQTWDALQFALKKHAGVKVERVEMDVDRERVRALRTVRKFMALPALYFYNPEGKLVAMLEGEVMPDKIAEALK
ncbi:MAG: hypothetical protein RBU30_16550 [Polyangia bacterium]|jgi:hypothetical protein|nr:hypothetical protein [Polyangia bacterium]